MCLASHDGLFWLDQVGAIVSQEKQESKAIGLRGGVIASTREEGGGGRWAGPWRKVRFAKKRGSRPLQFPLLGKEPLQTWVYEDRKKLLRWHFCGWLGSSSRSSWPPTDCVLGPPDLFPRMLYLLNLVKLVAEGFGALLVGFSINLAVATHQTSPEQASHKEERETETEREKERERATHLLPPNLSVTHHQFSLILSVGCEDLSPSHTQ